MAAKRAIKRKREEESDSRKSFHDELRNRRALSSSLAKGKYDTDRESLLELYRKKVAEDRGSSSRCSISSNTTATVTASSSQGSSSLFGVSKLTCIKIMCINYNMW